MNRFGLLGRRLSHSLSPQIHSYFGDYSYTLIEKEPEELYELFKSPAYDGFNVTIPYKKEVIKYLDFVDPLAKKIGSVNTVRFINGRSYGYNTDAYGFELLLKGIETKNKKALVLGSGGASVTVCEVLRERGAAVKVISRSGEDNYENIAKHHDAHIIVNTTPVGMYPETGVAPLSPDGFEGLEAVVDIVYNPLKTELILQAESRGIKTVNGLAMLVWQAKRAAEYFTGKAVDDTAAEKALCEIENGFTNIVLVGMPGCGKSTVGKLIAERLGRELVDTDTVTEQLAGKAIPEIIATDGVEAFRDIEAKAVATVGKRNGIVIATGGGAVLRPENRNALRQNGKIIFMERALEDLSTKGRPLSRDLDSLRAMYAQRKPIYESVSDIKTAVAATPGETAEGIMEALK